MDSVSQMLNFWYDDAHHIFNTILLRAFTPKIQKGGKKTNNLKKCEGPKYK